MTAEKPLDTIECFNCGTDRARDFSLVTQILTSTSTPQQQQELALGPPSHSMQDNVSLRKLGVKGKFV